MFARLSVDTDLVRDYGAVCAARASDLQAAAAQLNALGAGSATMFGPVGVRFLTSLARAVDNEARALTQLSGSVAGGALAASGSARAYEDTDDSAATRIDCAC